MAARKGAAPVIPNKLLGLVLLLAACHHDRVLLLAKSTVATSLSLEADLYPLVTRWGRREMQRVRASTATPPQKAALGHVVAARGDAVLSALEEVRNARLVVARATRLLDERRPVPAEIALELWLPRLQVGLRALAESAKALGYDPTKEDGG